LISVSPDVVAHRLYEWSLTAAERELSENFPLVGRVKGSNAAKYVRFLNQRSKADALSASRALVKRMNQPVLLRQKPALSAEEQTCVRQYLEFEELQGPFGGRMVRADTEERRSVRTREIRKVLKALIKERFRAEFGACERGSANEWSYEIPAGDIVIRTNLDVGGHSSLAYHHLVVQEGAVFPAHLSVLQWLGAATITNWNVLRAEELMDAADTVFALSMHFITEMKILFA
jgi:hypothetical protein